MVSQHLEGLNQKQRQAVETVKGPLLIVAGPGSGKTRVITHRIAYLVTNVGIDPYRILAVTFTNKASTEMRKRLQNLVGQKSNQLTVSTFHSFCASVLRRHGQHIGLDSNFTIFDEQDRMGLITSAMDEADIDQKRFPKRAIQGIISKAKSLLWDPQGLSLYQTNYLEEIAARVYSRYEELLNQNNAVDFDDLLMKAVNLLQNNHQVLEQYHNRYMHLMIDEFQDTNVSQYALAKLLVVPPNNICVVGDPDQSIYAWRNADIRNILSFQKSYPKATLIQLNENYRSTSTIIEAAEQLISSNRDRLPKKIWTNNHIGPPIIIHEAFNGEEEAEFVIRRIEHLVREKGVQQAECAVMYRVNAQSRMIEEACLKYGMKYRLVGGVRFYQRKEVKDLIAYLRSVSNPEDQVSLQRILNIPPRGVGTTTIDRLMFWAKKENITINTVLNRLSVDHSNTSDLAQLLPPRALKSLIELETLITELRKMSKSSSVVHLIDFILEKTSYRAYLQNKFEDHEDRWENISELRNAALSFRDLGPQEDLNKLLEHLALVTDLDSYDQSADGITLITLHQAKGLEFPVVFIIGLEEGLLPHSRSIDDPKSLEEERRLCYVGITRCMQHLYLLRAFRRTFMGSSGPTIPSRFLQEIPSSLLHSIDSYKNPVPNKKSVLSQSSPNPPDSIFETGDKVHHRAFGEGIVIKTSGSELEQEVTVAFVEGAGVKRLLLSYANLKKL
jgi:DNA helicase-2/ATP-dependent DNA helicase PcrA